MLTFGWHLRSGNATLCGMSTVYLAHTTFLFPSDRDAYTQDVTVPAAGIAVVDLDFEALEAVRQKMPIEQHRAKGRQQLAGQLG